MSTLKCHMRVSYYLQMCNIFYAYQKMINSKNYLHQSFFCMRFYLKNVLNFFIEETFEKICPKLHEEIIVRR